MTHRNASTRERAYWNDVALEEWYGGGALAVKKGHVTAVAASPGHALSVAAGSSTGNITVWRFGGPNDGISAWEASSGSESEDEFGNKIKRTKEERGRARNERARIKMLIKMGKLDQVRSTCIQTFFTHRSVSTLDRVPFQLTGEHFFCVWNGPQEHARGAVVAIPTLTPGRELKLSVKPGSAVVASGGTKTMRGEGFVLHHHAQHHPGGGGAGVTARRGDLHVRFRVMNALEQWLKADAARMRAARRAGYVAGGVIAAYATLRALAWVVEVRSPYTGSHTAASAW